VVVDSSTVRDVVTPSRPVVSPTYAQGSCYGRIESSPALPGASRVRPRRSWARRAQPTPRDPPAAASRPSVARTGRVSRNRRAFPKNRMRGRSARQWSSATRPGREPARVDPGPLL